MIRARLALVNARDVAVAAQVAIRLRGLAARIARLHARVRGGTEQSEERTHEKPNREAHNLQNGQVTQNFTP
jgi:hypothetical protein